MAYVQIPKDLSNVKTKVAFNLTKRQLIGFGVAGIIGIPTYLKTRDVLGNDLAVFLMIILTIPIFFVVFYEKDGLTCEKYLKYIYLHVRHQPKVRVSRERFIEMRKEEQNINGKNQIQQRNLEKRKRQEEKLQKKEKELKKVAKETRNLKSSQKKSSSFLDFLKKEKKRYTIEDTIPYKRMYRNGICYIGEGKYNKVIKYEDINYQLALEEDRDLIFNQFAGFLNSFDSTTELQLSFVNQVGRIKEMENAITIPGKGDGFDEIRKEFRGMLKDQLSKGNNGLRKSKYIVVKEDHRDSPCGLCAFIDAAITLWSLRSLTVCTAGQA